jgi:hypothetical protein
VGEDETGSARRTVPIIRIALLLIVALLLWVVLRNGPVKTLRGVIVALSEDTAYAPGFSESAFREIAIGATETSVRAALGAPLSEAAVEPYTGWLYAPNPQPEFATTGSLPDSRFSYTCIRFGEGGRFNDAFGQIANGSSTGPFSASGSCAIGDGINTLSLTDADIATLKAERATPEQIEARFGKPRSVFESRVARWLHYSRSPGSTHYRQRFIGIDRDGKVCRKVSEVHWD